MRSAVIALAALTASGAAPASSRRLSFADPRYDDKGPGSYVYPSDARYVRGTFDLRAFEVREDGGDVVFTVTFDAPIVAPADVRRGDSSRITLDNDLYLQNVDIYLDTDADPASGSNESIPGRNVRFAPTERWERAIVFSPLPFDARSALDGWTEARRVYVPADLSSRGTRVSARVPLHVLGGAPEPHWGYQVLVSGAAWSASFDAVARAFGEHKTNVYTMKVTTIAESDAFGGGELSIYHPAVIDLLAPEDRSQFAFLRTYDEEKKRLATVPMIYPDILARENAVRAAARSAARPVEQGAAVRATSSTTSGARDAGFVVVHIRSISGDLVVLEKAEAALPQFSMGTAVDAGGQVVGRVVITAEYPDFLLAQAVGDVGRLEAGGEVRFEKPKK